MDINKYAADKLKQLRIRKNMTQEELAEDLKITQQQVARYENNMRQFKQDFLFQLAEYFNVSINDFFPPLSIKYDTIDNFIKECNDDMMSQYRILFDKDSALTEEQKKFIIEFLEDKHRKIDNNEDLND